MSRRIHVCRAPGRLDIMGGNGDYTGGLVFEATIREATWAAVALRQDNRLRFYNPQVGERGWKSELSFELDQLTTSESVGAMARAIPEQAWSSYVIGALLWLRLHARDRVKRGADVYISSNVPLNQGVGSSAALEVAVMKAAAHAYGIDLYGVALAQACQWTENNIAQSACGVMDQAAVVLGARNCVLPLLCQPCQPLAPIRIKRNLQFWGIDSGISHAVTGPEHEKARAAAFMGYKLICDAEGLAVEADLSSLIPRFRDRRWNGYLANLQPSEFTMRYEQRIPEQLTGASFLAQAQTHVDPFTRVHPGLTYSVRACTRYAVEENARTRLFAKLARTCTEPEEMGELMYQSHAAYSECGLGTDATDELVDMVRRAGLERKLYGARISGGGAGGTVVVLGETDAAPAIRDIAVNFARRRGFTPHIFGGSSMGADRSGVQVWIR